jgi:hypothetical protein
MHDRKLKMLNSDGILIALEWIWNSRGVFLRCLPGRSHKDCIHTSAVLNTNGFMMNVSDERL